MLITTKMTCRTMQRTDATHAVRTESSVTWWITWNKTSCVHSWQLIALSAMRTFFGREQACQHGVHVERVVHSFRPKSELEIKKRREHVEQAKRNSTCRTCGWKGHWAGDQVCPNFVGNRSVLGSSTSPWSANWSRDVSKTDKKAHEGQRSAERCRETHILPDESAIQSRSSHCASHE